MLWRLQLARRNGVAWLWRRRPDVRRAMEQHRKMSHFCAYCGNPRVEIHHIIPLWKDPTRGAHPSNLISLCRKCHFVLGHYGNWRQFSPKVQSACHAAGRTDSLERWIAQYLVVLGDGNCLRHLMARPQVTSDLVELTLKLGRRKLVVRVSRHRHEEVLEILAGPRLYRRLRRYRRLIPEGVEVRLEQGTVEDGLSGYT